VKEMSVPIISTRGKREHFVLHRISTLLTPEFFAKENFDGLAETLATKRPLLDEEISCYIKERGGNECGRIRYGQPVKLTAVGTGRRLYYVGGIVWGFNLYDHDPSGPPEPGSSEAVFEIRRSSDGSGEDVLAGDLVNLRIQNGMNYLTIALTHLATGTPDPGPLVPIMLLSPWVTRREGEFSMRIRGSGQGLHGSEMTEKRRPLVSGDVVMISRYDQDIKKFVILTTPPGPHPGVTAWSRDQDELLAPNSSYEGREYFVIKNA
jgi:hypothetical protein